MECRPFRFKQRRTSVSGRKPSLNGLYDGELYLNTADGKAFFKDKNSEKLFTFITDASGNGLESLKFSGALSGDIPIWDGYKIIPTGFNGNNLIDTTSFVNTGDTGKFITTGQTGSFANSSGVVLLTGNQLISGVKNFDQRLTVNGTGVLLSGESSNLNVDNGLFQNKGDSEYLTYFARGLTSNNNWTKLSTNGSNSIYDLQYGDDVYFTVNITAAGNGKNAIFKIEGGAKRGLQIDEAIEYDSAVLLGSNIKNIIYRSANTYDVRVIVQSGSIKIECLGDISNELRWYAKIEMLKLNSIYS